MRRATRLVALVALATPGMLLVGTGIAAAAPTLAGTSSAKPGVVQAAWYWQTALRQLDPPVDPNEVPATEPSGVPEGDFGVANSSSDGSSSKMAALAFDIGSLKAGTIIDEFTVTLTLDDSPTAASLNAATARPVACLPTRAWPVGDPGPMADAPAVNCSSKVAPKVDGNLYTFKIAGLAQSWVDDQNLGVAFVNDPANTTSPFQLVFKGAKSVKATMTYTPPVKTSTSGDTGGDTVSATGGSTGGSTSGGTGAGTPVALPPVTVDVPSEGPTTGTVDPGAGQAPQVAGDAQNSPVTTAAAAEPAPSGPNAAFWIAGVALALLLVSAGFVLADPSVPVPAAAQTRLGRVLRERERSMGATTSTLASREA